MNLSTQYKSLACIFSKCYSIREAGGVRLFVNKIHSGVGHYDKVASRTIPRLDQANVYASCHAIQDRDAYLTLRRFKPRMKWRVQHKILDIGSGPGDITVNYLLPLVPNDGRVVGGDVSEAMIKFARSKYYDDPRLSFEVMDITSPEVGCAYSNMFDSVVSFYCLHWVQDQRMAMKNIYDVLRPGGEILLLFLATNPVFSLYEKLAEMERWAPYMRDYRQVISPYHHSADAEAEMKNILSGVGFDILECTVKPTTYIMPDRETLYKSIEAINPFLVYIPRDLLDQYREDCEAEMYKSRLCTVCEKTGHVTLTYSLITAYAAKPDNINDNQHKTVV